MISIQKVVSARERKQFIEFPHKLYRDHPYWIPPLTGDELDALDPKRNPAFQTAQVELFLARDGDDIVGRIAGILLDKEKEGSGAARARFGWCEFVDNHRVSSGLFRAVLNWAEKLGAEKLTGPLGFTNLDPAGFLIQGFEEEQTISANFNFPYYPEHLQNLHFHKELDAVEYELTVPQAVPEKIVRLAHAIRARYGLQVLTLKQKEQILRNGAEIMRLINITHRDLFGFVPYSKAQMEHYAAKYLKLMHSEFISLIADAKGDLVAYALTMPSLSRALRKADGNLIPFGYWHIRKAMRNAERAEMLMIGVVDAFRRKGVTALIFEDLINVFIKNNIKFVESNPELETNMSVRRLWKNYEARQHKRRRIFTRKI